MTSPPAPYGLLDTPRFPFPALAALAAQRPLGGAREAALACLLCARLADATLPPYRVAPAARQARAAATAAWLRALPLAPALAAAASALCTLAAPIGAALGPALRDLRAAAAPALDGAATAELDALADRLDAAPAPPP